MSENATFGIRLQQLRKRLGLNQRDFAKQISITASALSTYETGAKNPSVNVAIKIAMQFNVSLDWLCGLSDSDYGNKNDIIPFNMESALRGLIDLMQFGFVSYPEINPDDPVIIQNELRICNGDIAQFLYDLLSIEDLFNSGSISPYSYDICKKELIDNYVKKIYKNEKRNASFVGRCLEDTLNKPPSNFNLAECILRASEEPTTPEE